jgi:hypothetical protein
MSIVGSSCWWLVELVCEGIAWLSVGFSRPGTMYMKNIMAVIEGRPKASESQKELRQRRIAFLWLLAMEDCLDSGVRREAEKPRSLMRLMMSRVPVLKLVSYLKEPRFVSSVTLTSVTPAD